MHRGPAMLTLRRSGILLVVGALLAAACGDNDPGPGRDAADVASDEGEAVGEDLADQAEAELAGEPAEATVGRIAAILLELDAGEISQAEVALDLGSDPEVLDFAAYLREAHSVHDERVDDLLDARMLAPIEGAVSRALRDEASAGIAELERAPLDEVDFTYLRLQVKMHAAGEALVGELIDLAPPDDEELRELLVATRDELATHGDRAEALLRAR